MVLQLLHTSCKLVRRSILHKICIEQITLHTHRANSSCAELLMAWRATKVEDPDIECVNVIFMTTSVLNQIEFEFTKLLDNLYFLTVYSNKRS